MSVAYTHGNGNGGAADGEKQAARAEAAYKSTDED